MKPQVGPPGCRPTPAPAGLCHLPWPASSQPGPCRVTMRAPLAGSDGRFGPGLSGWTGVWKGAAERWSWAQDSGLWKGAENKHRAAGQVAGSTGSRNQQARRAGQAG